MVLMGLGMKQNYLVKVRALCDYTMYNIDLLMNTVQLNLE